MPRTTKDSEKDELNNKKSTSKKSATTTKKKKTSTPKTASKESKTTKKKETTPTLETKKISKKTTATKSKTKKETESPIEKKETKKKTASSSTTKKSTSTKKVATETKKKSTSTKATTTIKKTTSTKKKTTTSATKKKSTTKTKKLENNIVAEYYDLPYRYNETVVKILYQTPTILFVYWDISDYDRNNFIKQYGQNFFNNTRPVLKIYNLTKNYNFEVEINDFANSWYINVNDANCEYKVELARKTIKFEENINKEYIYVSSSNDIEFPNDRILLDELPNNIKFKNVKTNTITTKNIGTLHLVGINKIYKVHDFYKKFYKDEILEELDSKRIINPSSSSWN